MGGETALLFRLVDELADGIPTVCVLVGGGEIAIAEILRIVRRGWPLSVVTGSGGLADRLARSLEGPKADPVAGAGADPAIAEIVADGDIELLGLESDPVAFAAMLTRRLSLSHPETGEHHQRPTSPVASHGHQGGPPV